MSATFTLSSFASIFSVVHVNCPHQHQFCYLKQLSKLNRPNSLLFWKGLNHISLTAMSDKEELWILYVYTSSVCVFVCFIVYKVVKLLLVLLKVIKTFRNVRSVPGIGRHFWYNCIDDYIDHVTNHVQQTGTRIVKVWNSFLYPVYSLNHHDVIHEVLRQSFSKCDVCLGEWKVIKQWAEDSIICMNDKKLWEKRRSQIENCFSQDQIQCYMEKFNDCAEDLLIKLSRERYRSSVGITEPVTIATLDVMLRCAYSYDGDLQEQGCNHPYVQAVHRLGVLHKQRIGNPLLSFDFVYNRTIRGQQFLSTLTFIHRFTEKMIAKKIQSLMQDEKEMTEEPMSDYLDALLHLKDDKNNELSHKEMIQEIEAFLCKGQYSLSSALMWCLHALSDQPDIQTRVYTEVVIITGDAEIQWDDLPKLHYLDCFIKEVLRMYNIIPIIGRSLDQPVTLDGLHFCAGTRIQINLQAANHNPDVFKDHEVFRPERFCDDLNDTKFIPFSAGPRRCLGENFTMAVLKVFLCRILQTFQLEHGPSHYISSTYFLARQPKFGPKLFFHSR